MPAKIDVSALPTEEASSKRVRNLLRKRTYYSAVCANPERLAAAQAARHAYYLAHRTHKNTAMKRRYASNRDVLNDYSKQRYHLKVKPARRAAQDVPQDAPPDVPQDDDDASTTACCGSPHTL